VDVTYARKHACPLAHLGWTDGSQTEGYYVAKRRPSEPSLASAIAASVDVTDARKENVVASGGGGDRRSLATSERHSSGVMAAEAVKKLSKQ